MSKQLRDICENRLIELFGANVPSDVRIRMEEELRIIEYWHSENHFLKAKELVDYAGFSVYEYRFGHTWGNSYISFLLGITPLVDPIEYELSSVLFFAPEENRLPGGSIHVPKAHPIKNITKTDFDIYPLENDEEAYHRFFVEDEVLALLSILINHNGIDLSQVVIKKQDVMNKMTRTNRDDILDRLIELGMDLSNAYKMVDRARKGKGLTAEMVAFLTSYNLPEELYNILENSEYLPSKEYLIQEVKQKLYVEYCKENYPKEYEAAKKQLLRLSR